jgi:hypothetical protein
MDCVSLPGWNAPTGLLFRYRLPAIKPRQKHSVRRQAIEPDETSEYLRIRWIK